MRRTSNTAGVAAALSRELRGALPATATVDAGDDSVMINHESATYKVAITWDTDPFLEATSVGTALMLLHDGEVVADFPRASWSQVLLPGTRGLVDTRPAAHAITEALHPEGSP